MRLWTWHKPYFLLVEGKIDHAKSEYYNMVNGVPEAYKRLHQMIGTGQVIWCFIQREDHIAVPSAPEIEWELEVPEDYILGFVDTIMWNKILGIRCSLPSTIGHQWFDEARKREPSDANKRRQIEQQLKDKFWANVQPGVSWENLFLSNPFFQLRLLSLFSESYSLSRHAYLILPLSMRGHGVQGWNPPIPLCCTHLMSKKVASSIPGCPTMKEVF